MRKAPVKIFPMLTTLLIAIFCCDVLEHVQDLPKVISEILRVLKPVGVFFYDTLNRTFISKLVAIKIWQEWKRWAFMPPNLHVWKMFIKPAEIRELLQQKGLEWKEQTGSEPNVSIPKMRGIPEKKSKRRMDLCRPGQKFLGGREYRYEYSLCRIRHEIRVAANLCLPIAGNTGVPGVMPFYRGSYQ